MTIIWITSVILELILKFHCATKHNNIPCLILRLRLTQLPQQIIMHLTKKEAKFSLFHLE
jgi:hypothetical protein